MKIVGCGCGPGMLTEAAVETLRSATLVYGSGRSIELCKKYIPDNCEVHEISDYKSLKELPDYAVLLSTGDPMLAGLGYLDGEIISGISSMQYSFAKLRVPLTRSVVVNAHGKDHKIAVSNTVDEILRGKVVFLIADPNFDTKYLCGQILPENKTCTISVCENLGYENERIVTGSVSSPPDVKSDLFVIVAGDY
ncbi:cobalt-precorrin-7 (C(5))-methyltransferase [Methanoplanus sp. FWC-SCC4]|uniref:Cobalt-precorrin-7 (C(5))-methyltransferase n=1 Tax=Methanochimaera problematica TaxID=2609417 RepID=A0AA97FBC7_9EURY|nr:cobalt-precorrin-7 (C(5))-methyltransferase [Methanoplanus sp. FWC-SCC4]WOF15834.1 cobalt-precorrin-7 (C(5))-methyltransferase [Methanoplanus sp. FWC-SCC4]